MKLVYVFIVLLGISHICMGQADSAINYSNLYWGLYAQRICGGCYFQDDACISNDYSSAIRFDKRYFSGDFVDDGISENESNKRYEALQRLKKIINLSYSESHLNGIDIQRLFEEKTALGSLGIVMKKNQDGCTLQRLIENLPYPDSVLCLEYEGNTDAINLDLSLLANLKSITLDFRPWGERVLNNKVYDKTKYTINSKNLGNLKHVTYIDNDLNNISLQEFLQHLPNPDSLESLRYQGYIQSNDLDLSLFKNLKHLALICDSPFNKNSTLDISKLRVSSKKILRLNIYFNGSNIDSSLYNLQSIECLDLHTNIEYLPNGISKMMNLKSINLNAYEQESPSLIKSLPQDIGNTPKLNMFSCEFCCNLADLPESFGNASNMQTLFLTFMDSMKEFPVQAFQLKNLNNLIIDNKMIALLPSLDSKLKNKNVKTVIILRNNNGVGDYNLRYTQNGFKFSEKFRNKFKYKPILRKRFPNATIVFDAY